MFVHSVYFWLKDDLNDAQRRDFTRGVESLGTIESVRHIFVGTPAATDRPVIDRTYSVALTVIFDDLTGHDLYQEHPVHLAFVSEFGTWWTRVQIYDAN